MRKRTKIWVIVVALSGAIIAIVVWQQPSIIPGYVANRISPSTSALPECDRVEVFHIGDLQGGDVTTGFPIGSKSATILAQKTLTGDEATRFAMLWRSQRFASNSMEYQNKCHDPPFGLRFFRGSTLLFETSVCFSCSNFYVKLDGRFLWWGFDTKSAQAASLLRELQQIFPASIPEPAHKDGDTKVTADEEG